MLTILQQLWSHIEWADGRILKALREAAGYGRPDDVEQRGAVTAIDVLHEFAHVIGSEENWLARIEGREPRAAIWPEVSLDELEPLLTSTHERYRTYLADLTDEEAAEKVSYTNSTGRQFTSEIRDILLHVALHGQYHRGKVNLMLRQIGRMPAPTDYIAYARGVPAATRAMSAASSGRPTAKSGGPTSKSRVPTAESDEDGSR